VLCTIASEENHVSIKLCLHRCDRTELELLGLFLCSYFCFSLTAENEKMEYEHPFSVFFSKLKNKKWNAKKSLVFTGRRYTCSVYAVVMCPSVCLSVTSRHCTNMAKCRITQTTPYDSPGTLWFSDAKDLGEIPMGLLPTGAPNRGGVGSYQQFSTNISLYLKNCAR